MTQQELNALKALAAKATPGPWLGLSRLVYRDNGEPFNDFNAVCECWNDHDDDFIAAARTAVPALCDALTAARANVERLEAELAAVRYSYAAAMDGERP